MLAGLNSNSCCTERWDSRLSNPSELTLASFSAPSECALTPNCGSTCIIRIDMGSQFSELASIVLFHDFRPAVFERTETYPYITEDGRHIGNMEATHRMTFEDGVTPDTENRLKAMRYHRVDR